MHSGSLIHLVYQDLTTTSQQDKKGKKRKFTLIIKIIHFNISKFLLILRNTVGYSKYNFNIPQE